MNIKISDSAHTQILALLSNIDPDLILLRTPYIRLRVQGGGCSGLVYSINIDYTNTDNDIIDKRNGYSLIVDKKSILFIKNLEIDYRAGFDGKGFEFKNPQAKRTCGCGVSFSV